MNPLARATTGIPTAKGPEGNNSASFGASSGGVPPWGPSSSLQSRFTPATSSAGTTPGWGAIGSPNNGIAGGGTPAVFGTSVAPGNGNTPLSYPPGGSTGGPSGGAPVVFGSPNYGGHSVSTSPAGQSPTITRSHPVGDTTSRPNIAFLRIADGLLKQITPKNFGEILGELVRHITGKCGEGRSCCGSIQSSVTTDAFAELLLERALSDPALNQVHACLSQSISYHCPGLDNLQLLVLHKAHVAFRELEVKRFGPVDEEGYPLDPKDQPQYSAEELYADFMREQACVKFLGEMYKLNVFSREDFLKTVFFLMEDPTDEIAIELCCTILKTAGKHFEEDMGDTLASPEDEDSPDIVETAFGILETYASQDTMSGRLRGIITELLEFKAGNWTRSTSEVVRRAPISVRRNLTSKGSPSGASAPTTITPTTATTTSTTTTTAPTATTTAPPGIHTTTPPTAIKNGGTTTLPTTTTTSTTTVQPTRASAQPNPTATHSPSQTHPAQPRTPEEQEKLNQRRAIAQHILSQVKKHLVVGDELARHQEVRASKGSGPQEAAKEMQENRIWLSQLAEVFTVLAKQVGELPFLMKLQKLLGTYIKQTTNNGEDSSLDSENLALLRRTFHHQLQEIENVLKGPPFSSTATATATTTTTAPRTTSTTTTTTSDERPPFVLSAGEVSGGIRVDTGHSSTTTTTHSAPEKVTFIGPAQPPATSTTMTGGVGGGGDKEKGKEKEAPTAQDRELEKARDRAMAADKEKARLGWVSPELGRVVGTKNVNDLFGSWQTELKDYVLKLKGEAKMVAELGDILVNNEAKLSSLRGKVLAGDVHQTELSKGSQVVEEYQLLLDSLLSGVEEQCRRSYEKENADMLREEGYALATSIEKGLQDVTEALKDVFVIINKDLIAQADDLDQNIVQLENILNNNLLALQWVDETTDDLTKRIQILQKEATASSASPQKDQTYHHRLLNRRHHSPGSPSYQRAKRTSAKEGKRRSSYPGRKAN